MDDATQQFRDESAIRAMAAIVRNGGIHTNRVASVAFEVADLMAQERAKRQAKDEANVVDDDSTFMGIIARGKDAVGMIAEKMRQDIRKAWDDAGIEHEDWIDKPVEEWPV